MTDLEKAKEIFTNDRFATEAAGIEIEEAEKNHSRCSMQIKPVHLNAVGGVMGGALFTLADFAFAIASNLDSDPTVSLSSTIAFTGAAKGTKLTAEAKCLKDGRSTCLFSVTITDDTGAQVAYVTVTGFRKTQPKK